MCWSKTFVFIQIFINTKVYIRCSFGPIEYLYSLNNKWLHYYIEHLARRMHNILNWRSQINSVGSCHMISYLISCSYLYIRSRNRTSSHPSPCFVMRSPNSSRNHNRVYACYLAPRCLVIPPSFHPSRSPWHIAITRHHSSASCAILPSFPRISRRQMDILMRVRGSSSRRLTAGQSASRDLL